MTLQESRRSWWQERRIHREAGKAAWRISYLGLMGKRTFCKIHGRCQNQTESRDWNSIDLRWRKKAGHCCNLNKVLCRERWLLKKRKKKFLWSVKLASSLTLQCFQQSNMAEVQSCQYKTREVRWNTDKHPPLLKHPPTHTATDATNK